MKLTLEQLAKESPDFKVCFDKLKYHLNHPETLESLSKIDKEIIKIYLTQMIDVFGKKQIWANKPDVDKEQTEETRPACKYLYSHILGKAAYDEAKLYIDILEQDLGEGTKIINKQNRECLETLESIRSELTEYDGIVSQLLDKTKREVTERDGPGAGNKALLDAYDTIIHGIYKHEIETVCGDNKELKELLENLDSEDYKPKNHFYSDVRYIMKTCADCIRDVEAHEGFMVSENGENPNDHEKSPDKLNRWTLKNPDKNPFEKLFKEINETTIRERYNHTDDSEIQERRKIIEGLFVDAKLLYYAVKFRYHEDFSQKMGF